MPGRDVLLSTLKRSPSKAQRTWIKTHWGLKGSTKEALYEQAKKLRVAGRSRMDRKELARAISRKQ